MYRKYIQGKGIFTQDTKKVGNDKTLKVSTIITSMIINFRDGLLLIIFLAHLTALQNVQCSIP